MSRNHASQSFRVLDLIKQVNAVSEDDQYRDFGIEQDEDGTIFDTIEGKRFDTIVEWAQFNIEMEIQDAAETAGQEYWLED